MRKYKCTVTMTHTFTQTEIFDIEVEAKTEHEALGLAREHASTECAPDCFQADYDDSDDHIEVKQILANRCKKTQDMFEASFNV